MGDGIARCLDNGDGFTGAQVLLLHVNHPSLRLLYVLPTHTCVRTHPHTHNVMKWFKIPLSCTSTRSPSLPVWLFEASQSRGRKTNIWPDSSCSMAADTTSGSKFWDSMKPQLEERGCQRYREGKTTNPTSVSPPDYYTQAITGASDLNFKICGPKTGDIPPNPSPPIHGKN